MYDALNASVIPKKQKKIPVATAAKPPQEEADLPTINDSEVKQIVSVNEPPSEYENANNNNNNNVTPQDLPPNFELFPFDETDDFLLEYLKKNPSEITETPATTIANKQQVMTTTVNTMTTAMPIIPKMYFPNSNVTINYNFSK